MEMSILQVIAESEQLRMDSDDLGPRAELDYWKKRMSCCNYLLDQIKSPDVSTVFGVLLMSKSKLIKVRHLFYSWKVFQDCVFHHKVTVCFFADMARTGHPDNRCIQRSQRQCQVPVQSGEVLWSSIQQWPCKKSIFKMGHVFLKITRQLQQIISLYYENSVIHRWYSL